MGTLYKLQKIVYIEESSSNCSCLTLNSLIPPSTYTTPNIRFGKVLHKRKTLFQLFTNIKNSF